MKKFIILLILFFNANLYANWDKWTEMECYRVVYEPNKPYQDETYYVNGLIDGIYYATATKTPTKRWSVIQKEICRNSLMSSTRINDGSFLLTLKKEAQKYFKNNLH